MPNSLKRDPSHTTMLRKKYMVDMKRRFKAVSRAIEELIVKDDALGLITSKPLFFMQQVPKQAWRFKSDANKVKEYRKWLQQQIDAKILTVHAVSGQPWTATYAESAYRKGMMKAYTQVHKQALAKDVVFYEGGKAQFLREAFASPISLSKIELMYVRAFDELKGVTAAMGQQMSRILASGMIKGDGPRAIARELRRNVATITNKRALVIARTEVIYAHAEGQLDAFERLGVEELGLMAEWLTAGDDRVCEQCGGLEGETFKVDEVRGMLPIHPNCRCAWMPFLKGVSRKRTKREIREKLKTAIPRWPSTKRGVKAKRDMRVKPKKMITIDEIKSTPVKSNGKKFTAADRLNIRSYTEDGYLDVVPAQLGRTIGYAEKRAGLMLAKSVEEGLLKLKGYQGISYRAIRFTEKKRKDFLSLLGKSDVYKIKAFQSSTLSKKEAIRFGGRLGHILFTIKGKSGRNIIKYSARKYEKEILFMKGSTFKVGKIIGNEVYLIEI